MADHSPDEVAARTTYTTAHPATWGTKVSAYLVTKAIAAGTMLVAALLVARGHSGERAAVGVVAAVVAGLFTAITGVLLVADLKQPKRFWFLITKPNTSSWLVRGAWILGGFALVTALWGLAGIVDAPAVIEVLALPTALLAAGTAGYTAFLFGQCEGRDLWQTPLLLPILLAQATVAGGATYSILDVVMDVPDVAGDPGRDARSARRARRADGGRAVVDGPLVDGESQRRTGDRRDDEGSARRSVLGWRDRRRHRRRPRCCWPSRSATDSGAALPAIAGLLIVSGLFWYEDAFVRAGQSVPLS